MSYQRKIYEHETGENLSQLLSPISIFLISNKTEQELILYILWLEKNLEYVEGRMEELKDIIDEFSNGRYFDVQENYRKKNN